MATIIEIGQGFIAGDPPESLPDGRHWCDFCGGSGLEWDYDRGEQGICLNCFGLCALECDDPECEEHRAPTL